MSDGLNISQTGLTSQFDDVYPEQHDLIYTISRESIASEFESRGLYTDAKSFMDCHTEFFVLYCPDCGFHYPVPLRCDFRLCPTCGRKRLNDMVNRFSEFLPSLENTEGSKGYRIRRFELGFPKVSSDDYSPEIYGKIRGCFNRMWNFQGFRSKFKKDVGGLCYAIETKYSKRGDMYFRRNGECYVIPEDGFNIHIHGFAFCGYIQQRHNHEFSNLWSKATDGRADYAYIDLCRSIGGAVGETLKYMFKPPVLGSAFNYGRYHEYTKAIRLFGSKGSFRKISLAKKKPVKDKVHFGCFFDGSRLTSMDSNVGRDEALDIVLNRRVPSRFIDSYLKSSGNGLIVPVVNNKSMN